MNGNVKGNTMNWLRQANRVTGLAASVNIASSQQYASYLTVVKVSNHNSRAFKAAVGRTHCC